MTKRIHVVGSSPRTGTTLITELLVNCFQIDGFAEHEMSVFHEPKLNFSVFCSKYPSDILSVRALLNLNPDLWIIHMERDPRDVIVSRHLKDADKYWTNLGRWKSRRSVVNNIGAHPRFLTIRYEDLVSDPNETQMLISKWAKFLHKKANFNEYHQIATPSKHSLDALRGVRPITTDSIGIWRKHKPRIAAQIELYGSISEDLIKLGYETDTKWVSELEGIDPENGISYWPEKRPLLKTLAQATLRHIRIVRYAFGIKPKIKTLQK